MKRGALVALIVLCSACTQTPEPEPAPTPTPTITTPAPTPTPTPTILPAKHHDSLGVGFTLVRRSGDEIRVNAVDAKDPARINGRAPAPGSRFIAVQLELTNVGQTTYVEQPHDAARMRQDKTLFAPLTDDPFRPGFGSQVAIQRGAFKRAWLTFEIPNGITPVFRFTPDGGMATDIAEWSLR